MNSIPVKVNTLRRGRVFRFPDGTRAKLVYVNQCRAYVQTFGSVRIKDRVFRRREYWNICPETEVLVEKRA